MDVGFAHGRPASKLRLSMTVGRYTASHQFTKTGPVHWNGHMYVAVLILRFLSMTLSFVSRCPVSSSCTIIVSRKRFGLLWKKMATFDILLAGIDTEDVSSQGNSVISALLLG